MTSPEQKKITLPEALPIMPLSGALLLPNARLSLNIFEPRYISMIEDSLGQSRMVGIIQPSDETGAHSPTPLYSVGSAGRIISFVETDDNRFLVTLQGVCRFEILKEEPSTSNYRIIRPEWKNYVADLTATDKNAEIDRKQLVELLRDYFKKLGMNVDWEIILSTNNDDLISSLGMLCPLQPNEKQALLEAHTQEDRAKILLSLLEMACLNMNTPDKSHH